MRRVPISIKLWAALAAPLLGLLAITVIEVAQASRKVHSVSEQADLATAPIGPTGVTEALENERNFAVTYLIGLEDEFPLEAGTLEESRTAADTKIDEFRAHILQRGGAVAEAYRPALEGLSGLEGLRQEIDGNTSERTLDNSVFSSTVFDGYADLIAPFLDANTRVAVAIDDPELRQGAELVDTISRQIEVIADLSRTLLQSALTEGPADRGEVAEIATLTDLLERNDAALQAAGRDPYRSVVASGLPEQLNTQLLQLADTTIAGQEVPPERILSAVDVPEDQSYIGFRDDVSQVLRDKADSLADAARQRVWVYWILALLAIGITVLATWLVSRSITRPLRALTRQATEMANHRLPDAVLDILDTPLGDDVTV
ncbi:MAG TPA: nitrate- and nitrite sensing domain-containing protein, partial [Acidimicrobiales bacterium]|nr:nitrate- and nitrite sensing domain-containing protein [Acidimicrobiales bacterium]